MSPQIGPRLSAQIRLEEGFPGAAHHRAHNCSFVGQTEEELLCKLFPPKLSGLGEFFWSYLPRRFDTVQLGKRHCGAVPLPSLEDHLDEQTDPRDTTTVGWCVYSMLELLKAHTPAEVADLEPFRKRLDAC